MKRVKAKQVLSCLLVVLTAISLVIVSGVNGCPSQTPTTSDTVGIEMSFVKDAPPIGVNVNQEFPIYVDILNKGGEFVNKGDAKFYLSNLGPNFENVKTSLSNERTLSKESVFPDRIIFAEKAKFTFPLQAVLQTPLVLTSCYYYSGLAQASICVTGSNESKVCKVSGEKITSNTAGPVKVTSLTESATRNKLTLVFEIANVGSANGQVYLVDTDCDKLEAKDFAETSKQGKLNIKITTKDNFKCKLLAPTGGSQIEGLEGVAPLGKIICEKDITTEDYASALTIELKYKYRDSISQSLNILPA